SQAEQGNATFSLTFAWSPPGRRTPKFSSGAGRRIVGARNAVTPAPSAATRCSAPPLPRDRWIDPLPTVIQLVDHGHPEHLPDGLAGPPNPFPVRRADQVQPRRLQAIQDQVQLVTSELPVGRCLVLSSSLGFGDAVSAVVKQLHCQDGPEGMRAFHPP